MKGIVNCDGGVIKGLLTLTDDRYPMEIILVELQELRWRNLMLVIVLAEMLMIDFNNEVYGVIGTEEIVSIP